MDYYDDRADAYIDRLERELGKEQEENHFLKIDKVLGDDEK